MGFGVWAWGLGFGVWGLGFGVWGLGFRVLGNAAWLVETLRLLPLSAFGTRVCFMYREGLRDEEGSTYSPVVSRVSKRNPSPQP